MDTKKLNLFVFDTPENFEKSKKFLGVVPTSFKDIVCIEDEKRFEEKFNALGADEYVFLVVHVFATEKISGIKRFMASGLARGYPNVGFMYISEGDNKLIQKEAIDAEIEIKKIHKYYEVKLALENDQFQVYTKKEIQHFSLGANSEVHKGKPQNHLPHYKNFDYAVITALYKDEFEELEKIFDFPKGDYIKIANKTFYHGFLKSNRSKEIIAAVSNETGMVDSAIVATLILEHFKPKYLFMSGVCGGSNDYDFGDIIIAKQVFTFQKGKVSDLKREVAKGELIPIEIFDKDGGKIDYSKLFDNDGNQVSISIEKFEIEQDSVIGLETHIEDLLRPRLSDIEAKVNQAIKRDMAFAENKQIKIEIAPIACSTMVINKAGFFEDTIKSISRKTAAVEMESYGVARACVLANEGKTFPIIFKSVMDRTHNKTDNNNGINVKKFAAYISAQFLKFILEDNIL